MRLKAISVSDVLPVRKFDIDKLSDVIVIAGQNGVGKSRLVDGLLSRLQNPHPHQSAGSVRLVVEATSEQERVAWGQAALDTGAASDLQKLATTLQANRSRTKWESSVVHFESDRSIAQIHPYQFTWDAVDPWGEHLGWNMTFGGLKARFQDTLHSLFRKVQSHEKQIARRAKELQAAGAASMDLDFRGCPNFCVRTTETCPRRRASLATNARRGGQVGATSYVAAFVKRSS
jgi:DNA repair ATPase RecN